MKRRGDQQHSLHVPGLEQFGGIDRVVMRIPTLVLQQHVLHRHPHDPEDIPHLLCFRSVAGRRPPGKEYHRRLARLVQCGGIYQPICLLIEVRQGTHVGISTQGSTQQHNSVCLFDYRHRPWREIPLQRTHQIIRKDGCRAQVQPGHSHQRQIEGAAQLPQLQ